MKRNMGIILAIILFSTIIYPSSTSALIHTYSQSRMFTLEGGYSVECMTSMMSVMQCSDADVFVQAHTFAGFDSTLGTLQQVSLSFDRIGGAKVSVANSDPVPLSISNVEYSAAMYFDTTISNSLTVHMWTNPYTHRISGNYDVLLAPGYQSESRMFEYDDGDGQEFDLTSWMDIEPTIFENELSISTSLDLYLALNLVFLDPPIGTVSATLGPDQSEIGVGLASITYEFTYDDGLPAPIPEPATMLLLGSGLIGLVGLRRKFKKS